MVRSLFGVGLTDASVPLVVPPSPGGGSAVLPRRRTQRSPHSPFFFPEDFIRPPSNIEEFISFGQEEGDDAMSISASEREDWAGSEPDHLDSSEPSDLQEELMRVTRGISGPHAKLTRGRRFLSSPTYTSSW